MIYDNDVLVNEIVEFIKEKQNTDNLPKGPIREDVFSVLERESILLYYPLEDQQIKGCHMEKVLNDEIRQFVFINTIKPIQEQTWTAAHELGHVWKVDHYVLDGNDYGSVRPEDIVNRFASELLFPKYDFLDELQRYLKEYKLDNKIIVLSDFIGLITYLMNYFCAPYKAVIRRLVELKIISRNNEQKYILAFGDNIDYYNQIINERYYPRLSRTEQKACSMEHIDEDIELLSQTQKASDEVIKRYREMFRISSDPKSGETFVLGGENE